MDVSRIDCSRRCIGACRVNWPRAPSFYDDLPAVPALSSRVVTVTATPARVEPLGSHHRPRVTCVARPPALSGARHLSFLLELGDAMPFPLFPLGHGMPCPNRIIRGPAVPGIRPRCAGRCLAPFESRGQFPPIGRFAYCLERQPAASTSCCQDYAGVHRMAGPGQRRSPSGEAHSVLDFGNRPAPCPASSDRRDKRLERPRPARHRRSKHSDSRMRPAPNGVHGRRGRMNRCGRTAVIRS